MKNYTDEHIERDIFVKGDSLAKNVETHESALQTILELVGADPEFGEVVGINESADVSEEFARGIANLVSRIDQNEEDFRNFPKTCWGVGGHIISCFLKAYLGRFQNKHGNLVLQQGTVIPVNPKCSLRITGKIREYSFHPHEPYGPIGNGRLIVDVVHQKFDEMRAPSDPMPTQTEEYQWTVQLRNARVLSRNDEGYYEYPFPSLQGNPDVSPGGDRKPKDPVKVVFPKEATNPCNPNGIWRRGLDHKIYAEGGEEIIIEEILRSINGGPKTPLPANHPWRQITPESCVDLMFKGYPPAEYLPVQREYCLGRCAHPVIVNSGGD